MGRVVVHATHEAGLKVGGIGAVLSGLLGSPTYNREVDRTILVGPYDRQDEVEQERLRAPRNGLTIRYHASEGINELPEPLAMAFHQIQQFHRVSILYGTRSFGEAKHEVILVDSGQSNREPVDQLKAYLYTEHGYHSDRHQGNPEFDIVVRGAVAQASALAALLVDDAHEQTVLMAHEWLGLPMLFAAERQMPGRFRTVFYAHETATVRALVEIHPGHDVRFYNVLRLARQYGLSMEEVFGDQSGYFKHGLLRAALSLDGIFAVGDLVKQELQFLEPAIRDRRVDLVYNGVPSDEIGVARKATSKALLQQYAETLYGFRPSWIFTHVTRMVPSKGLWRDIRVMERMDRMLADRGESALLILLSSVRPTGRRAEDVMRWEREYGWPVHHRADNGDLIAYEWDYYQAFEQFNRSARASRLLLVNQFGWSRDRCGMRMPEQMQFNDLRHGADLEFGQSIYEPFGIAQVEPLSYGAICVPSSACGCVGFLEDIEALDEPNVLIADYLYLPEWYGPVDLHRALAIGRDARDAIEAGVADQVAADLIDRLPRTESALRRRLERGYDLSTRMSWEVVVSDYLLPALDRLYEQG